MRFLSYLTCVRGAVLRSNNLLGPDILCEIVIHVCPDFSRRVYVSKLDAPVDTIAKIAQSVVQSGVDLAAQHGITIQYQQEGITVRFGPGGIQIVKP